MKYLWIGANTDDELKKRIIGAGGKILSAAVSETNLLEGLHNNGINIDTVNSYRFPLKLGDMPERKWDIYGGTSVSVAYKNKKPINRLSREKALVKAARRWANKNKNEEVTIFVYAMHSTFMVAAKEVKKIIPKSKYLLIVPDLPQYMDLGMSRLKAFLKEIDWIRIKNLAQYVDKYILYSKHMAEFLKLKDGTFTVMEGSVNEKDIVEIDSELKKKAVMYSGVCDLRYGIPELLKAFSLIPDKDLELWITGAGNAESLIKEYAEKDERIKYFGFLPSRKDLLIKQKEAFMLVNMRKPDEVASKYCFPSKIFEYMLSGNPVLSFKIPGIPDEYFDYLIPMESTKEEDIKNAILKVLDMDENERLSLGKRSKEYIINNKNKNAQAKKILEFCNE